ncbi:MAG: sensor histidine kinase, partial [Actinomycetota bacterium]
QREFVSNASHQLRTPLTGMKLRLESAIAEAEDGDVRRQLQAADREVDRLSEIVARLLETSGAIEEGRPTHVDLGDAIARAVARWGERAKLVDTMLNTRGAGGIAQGNPSDLDQILDNLIDNAISYAPGEVTIEAGRRDGTAFVAVQDRGPGIAEDEIARVAERFYRGRAASSGGSGLGLAIARDLAERWGGTLAVSSETGKGTRVEISLRSLQS